MKKLGMTMDNDVKSLLIAGDVDMINEVLKEIIDYEMNRIEKMSQASSK